MQSAIIGLLHLRSRSHLKVKCQKVYIFCSLHNFYRWNIFKITWQKWSSLWHDVQNPTSRLLPPRSRLNVLHNFLTLWKIFNNLAQIITIMRLYAHNINGTTSRLLSVKGQEVHMHVCCRRGFSCPSDCLVSFFCCNWL
jgi:hypothetical protein